MGGTDLLQRQRPQLQRFEAHSRAALQSEPFDFFARQAPAFAPHPQ